MKQALIICLAIASLQTFAQTIYEEERYVPETDPLVLEKLDEWQDKKFGLLMHWGAYSQWGIVESWSLSPEEYGWCVRTKVNNTAIYGTKPIAPYKESNICFTQNKEGNVFFMYLADEGEVSLPSEIIVKSITPKKEAKISLLGSKANLKWKPLEVGFKVIIPKRIQNNPASKYAWAFKISSMNL